MKIIDLLNKIANNDDIPKEIVYDDIHFYLTAYGEYLTSDGKSFFDEIYYDFSNLNYKVEIIEEDKKIKKLNLEYIQNNDISKYFGNKINEIIDVLNKE